MQLLLLKSMRGKKTELKAAATAAAFFVMKNFVAQEKSWQKEQNLLY